MLTEKEQRLTKKLKGELGAVIITALEDPAVIEIMLNSDGQIWVERMGQPMIPEGSLSPVNAMAALGTIADSLGIVVTKDSPIVEGELFLDGSRFEGLIPPVVSRPTFTIRKKASSVFTLDDYVKKEIMTDKQKTLIEQAVKNRKNILVIGGTGSGKTTLTNAIIDAISKLTVEDRLVIIEDTSEIQCSAPNTVILRSSVEIDMQRLLKATMRLRPDRIIVGEVRGGEALALLKAWNTGHPGGVATLHANSAHAGLIRLEQLIAEAAPNANMKNLIAEAVDLLIFIQKTDKSREIKEIAEVIDVNENGKYDLNQIK